MPRPARAARLAGWRGGPSSGRRSRRSDGCTRTTPGRRRCAARPVVHRHVGEARRPERGQSRREARRRPRSSVARSRTTSTAGGREVSDAAANSTVSPSPSSTSTKRRRRRGTTSVGVAKTADGGEVQRAEHEEPAEDHHLGREHHAVGGPDQRGDSVDVERRQPQARGHQGDHRRQRQGGEAAQCPGGPRPRAAAEGHRGEMREPAHPGGHRDLVEPVEGEEQPPVLDAPRGMAGQGRADGEHRGQGQERPPSPVPVVAPDGPGHDDDAEARRDPDEARLEVARREHRAERPAALIRELADLRRERERLGDRCARGPERDEPARPLRGGAQGRVVVARPGA